MKDVGISCQKLKHSRPSKPLQCDEETEERGGGLCYTPCRYGANGVGPICWGSCPNGTTPCGGSLCLQPSVDCSAYILSMIKDAAQTVIGITDKQSTAETMIDMSVLASGIMYPVCPDY